MSFQLEDKTICRVCTQKQHDTSSIFNTKMFLKQSHVISDVMMTCASIQVHKNDGLPENICTHCLDELHQAYNFKKLCEKSDCVLRKQLLENQSCVKQEIKTEKEDEAEFIDTYNLFNMQTPLRTNESEFEFIDAEETFNSHLEDERDVEKDNEDNNSDYSLDKDLLEAEKPKDETIDITEYAITEEHVTENKKPANSCEICNKTFRNETALAMHIKYNIKCHECDKRFCNSQILRTHASGHLNIKTLKCDVCSSSFITKFDLVRHKKDHSKSHKCLTCGKRFATTNYLKMHQSCHLREEEKVCDLCGEEFRNNKVLRRHKRSQHIGPYKCMSCNKAYHSPKTMRTHYKIYHLNQCDICDEQFTKPADVINHCTRKKHCCKVCNKSYTKISKFNAHMKFHADQKGRTDVEETPSVVSHAGAMPHECDVCGKQYSERSFLIKHKRMHKWDKRFKCEICDESFFRKETLEHHIRCHTGEKLAFKCGESNKEFL